MYEIENNWLIAQTYSKTPVPAFQMQSQGYASVSSSSTIHLKIYKLLRALCSKKGNHNENILFAALEVVQHPLCFGELDDTWKLVVVKTALSDSDEPEPDFVFVIFEPEINAAVEIWWSILVKKKNNLLDHYH